MRVVSAIGLVVATLWSPSARAADILVDAHPSDVTVFADGAIVHRTGTTNLPAGSHTLIVRGLPGVTAERSLRVQGEGAFVIGSVETRPVNGTQSALEAERIAEAKVNDLTDRRKALEAEKVALEAKRTFVNALAEGGREGSADALGRGNVDPAQWRRAWEAIETGHAEAGKAIVGKEAQLRRHDAELLQAQAELQAAHSARRGSMDVRIAVEAKRAGPINLDLSYRVSDAAWAAVYDLRLDSEKQVLTLAQFGAVTQRSGEDWKDVRLTLSTARSNVSTAVPMAYSWWVDLPPKRDRYSETTVSAAGSAMPAPAAAMAPREGPVQKLATVKSGEFAAEFQVPGEISVSSGTVEKRVALVESSSDVRIELRTTPAMETKAYLFAMLRYQGKAPLQGGQAALYRDGAFIGETPFPPVRAGEEAGFGFGPDEQIKLRRTAVVDERSRAGAFDSDTVLKKIWRTEIENLHGRPIRLTVMERLPVSRNESLRVEAVGAYKEPSRTELEGRAGLIGWDIDLNANETRTLEGGFEARWPEGQQPIGL